MTTFSWQVPEAGEADYVRRIRLESEFSDLVRSALKVAGAGNEVVGIVLTVGEALHLLGMTDEHRIAAYERAVQYLEATVESLLDQTARTSILELSNQEAWMN